MNRALLTILTIAAAPLVRQDTGDAVPRSAPNPPHPRTYDERRFLTSRTGALELFLPQERDAFTFAVFGDRTGGPAEGVKVLARAVEEVNLIEPDLVMTVGDLVQGYNETPAWLIQTHEFKGIMDELVCPWFPVAGNHDVYWRGPAGAPPVGEHDANYEEHFGPLWYAFRHKSAWFIVLYSDEGNPATGEKTFSKPDAQRVSPEQFEWLEHTLERTWNAEHVFVFLHHPRWLAGGYGDDWERVHALLARAGNVKAVFAGHIHRMRYDGDRDGIEYFTLATVGGAQSGVVPDAGYLHAYTLVTVRDNQIAVASYPVGSAFDLRAITGKVSDDAATVAYELAPRFAHAPELDAELGARDTLVVEVKNPGANPLVVELSPTSEDPRWMLAPDHHSAVLEAGATQAFAFRAGRIADDEVEFVGLPTLTLVAEYLSGGHRFAIPARAHIVPVRARELAAPPVPEVEMALALTSSQRCLRAESSALDVPDGPFTLEAWLRADALAPRAGIATKTENSEYGLFAKQGQLSFSVHLDGAYVEAASPPGVLETGSWHHVAGVFDGAEVRLYLDGVRLATAPGAGTRTRNDLPLLVGADVDKRGNPTSPFTGLLDEVRLSKVARYAGERFTPQRRLQSDSGAVLHLHMDADVGPWVFDSSPAHAHPRRVGGASTVPAE